MLMDKTLGVSSVVSPSNIEALVDSMEAGLIKEIEAKSAAKVKEVERKAAARVREARDARTAAEEVAATATATLATSNAEDREIVRRLLSEVNSRLVAIESALKLVAAVVALIIGFGPVLAESLDLPWKFVPLVVIGIFVFIITRRALYERLSV